MFEKGEQIKPDLEKKEMIKYRSVIKKKKKSIEINHKSSFFEKIN